MILEVLFFINNTKPDFLSYTQWYVAVELFVFIYSGFETYSTNPRLLLFL